MQFPLRCWASFQHQTCTTFPSSLFTNDLFFLSKSAPQDTANRWGLKSLAVAGTPCQSMSNAQRTAGRTRKEERALSFRAAITEPAEGWHPLSTMWGVKHSLTPQGTSTRSSLLWSHSRAVMGEDWAHPMRILLQSPADQQSPEVRKRRLITWWE